MESLFVGNSVILLFWVFISFVFEIQENYKIVFLMYIITYLACAMNIVPTVQAYALMFLALFIDMEFLHDQFKRRIINGFIEKMMDFFYIMFFQYSFIFFTISLVMCSDYLMGVVGQKYKTVLFVISALMLYVSCKHATSEKYVVRSFDEIKKKMDECCSYRDFVKRGEEIAHPDVILYVEDVNFFNRKERYTFFNSFYLSKRYVKKTFSYIKRFFRSKEKRQMVSRVVRGYSTIEMQLLRTLAVEEGYEYIFRRKLFELLYGRLFWKNLRKYYERCGCQMDQFKQYILYLYMRIAPCINSGGEDKLHNVIEKSRHEEICRYGKEELFVLVLCFSGKIRRPEILEIYEGVIGKVGMDKRKIQQLIRKMNG